MWTGYPRGGGGTLLRRAAGRRNSRTAERGRSRPVNPSPSRRRRSSVAKCTQLRRVPPRHVTRSTVGRWCQSIASSPHAGWVPSRSPVVAASGSHRQCTAIAAVRQWPGRSSTRRCWMATGALCSRCSHCSGPVEANSSSGAADSTLQVSPMASLLRRRHGRWWPQSSPPDRPRTCHGRARYVAARVASQSCILSGRQEEQHGGNTSPRSRANRRDARRPTGPPRTTS